MFDSSKYHYFIQIVPTRGEQSLSSYKDKDGNTYKAIASINEGKEKAFWVTWSARERRYRLSKTQEVIVKVNGDVHDEKGKLRKMKLYDYIRNSDICAGSPNIPEGVLPIIKEEDPIKDAKLVVDRKMLRFKATKVVAEEMKIMDIAAFAPLIGCFDDNPDAQLRAVLEFADNEPVRFMEMYESPSKNILSLVKKAIQIGEIKKEGRAFVFDKEVFADEDDLVKMLLKNDIKLKALQTMVKAKK